ncbi:MAG: dinitrogenase iron-molybdenum cofactor biosynthesis protein [Candidatus Wallbacteria bacterium HGW-Wallbacteria-1]|jgi:predicted Fe-Mo cluster-binding NifX family protein|uniref:Dinitrogenase iron-molybdenum cofactor biosynthesis protein n=1 Tax=Candidatus Wallbacteria bacterium HGW-Wallbacteria-1 TaxID=2013854 RepID=A0A2N1PL84_9BACT|nr:MAG: dinitrogenase iron-molybdenum cofactor biosynthesis protein [Candidatus Wallbacteria bacterium HGW-Wallbacteria-1]
MKIAISTTGNTLNASMDQRFGRASMFIVWDSDSASFTTVRNDQNMQAAQGAGIQSARNVANAGVNAVITGHCGPKAFRALSAAGIAVYNCAAATVAQALDMYNAGELTQASTADVEGHWV